MPEAAEAPSAPERASPRSPRPARVPALVKPVVFAAVVLASLTALSSLPARDAPTLGDEPGGSTTGARGPNGYVFGDGGRIVLSAGRRSVLSFVGAGPCDVRVAIVDVPVSAGGTFAASVAAGGRGSKRVSVTGRVVGEDLIAGAIAVEGGGCDAEPVRYSARLS